MTSSIIAVKGHENKCSAIAYDDLSNNVMTVDFGGVVHVWNELTDNCVKSYSVSSNVNCMVYEKNRIFIASSMNIVESYCTDNSKNVAVLAQFLSEVNHMRLSRDKSFLVSCSSDNSAKVLQLSLDSDNELREILLTGHESPIMSVDIDTDCTLVATASCDGFIIIWRARDGVQLTKLPILDEVKDISQAKNLCRLRFSPSSDPILAVPLTDSISLLDCDDWSLRGSLTWDKVCNKPIAECLFTDDGDFLIAGTMDGHVIVWNIKELSIVDSWSSNRGSAITGMLWYPKKDKSLLFSDASGYWEALNLDFKNKDRSKETLSLEEIGDLFEDCAEEDFDDVDLDKESMASTVKQDSQDGSDIEDEFNISLIKAEYGKKEDTAAVAAPIQAVVQHVEPKKTVHPPVRPGATPIHDGMRLLLWNSVGALKKHYDDEGNSDSLEVYFHDCNQFRSIIVKSEIIDCDMGDLNTFAILLVSEQENDDDMDDNENGGMKPATVFIQSVSGSWPTWRTVLPVGENPVACCLVGEDYAMVLSDNGLLRYFSLSVIGLESYVESVHGRPVAMVSSGRGGRVVTVVEDPVGSLMWRLEEVRPGLMMHRGQMVGSVASPWHPLPLSAEDARLTWIGFSDSGVLHTVDSRQCVRRLQMSIDPRSGQWSVARWTAVLCLRDALDKTSRATDRLFPVGFTDLDETAGALTIRCTASRYPSLVPWPPLSVVPYKAPRCSSLSSVDSGAQLEASWTMLHTVRQWTNGDDDDDNDEPLAALEATDRELLLKLFLNAITQNADGRALAIAKLMPDSTVVQIAIRAALRQRKKVLADHLGKLALSMDEAEESLRNKTEQGQEESEGSDHESEEVNEEDAEEDDEEEEEEEEHDSEGDENSYERPSVPQRMPSVVNVDKLLNGPSPAEEMLEEQETVKGSPFRVVSKTALAARKGINVVDKLGLSRARKHTSPKKSALVFGNFVPSPSTKTFMIKPKRKLATSDGGSPMMKRTKK